jgi:DNA-binding SARP family transcriptional activator
VELSATGSAPALVRNEPPASPVDLTSRMTEFRMLGPLEVAAGAEALPLGGGKARALLARLLVDVNRTVSIDALVDALWGDEAPASAVKMVQVHVSALRKVLPDGTLRTRAPGYALEIAPEAVDLVQFTRLRAEGREALTAGGAETAAERLRAALALWRGAALAELSEPFATMHAAHLEELRIACLEDRIEADLALGHHADLIGELRGLVESEPLRERPRRQLMLALYRAGRQAEALDVYHAFRATLREELGMEPSAALGELQRHVLNHDAALDVAPRAQRRAIVAPPVQRIERPELIGRADDLARLERAFDAAAAGRGATALIVGPAGIGKTVLAAELADHARERGATVLTGRCIDLIGAGLAYLPVVEAMRPLCGSPLLAEVRGELRELPRLHPDLHPDLTAGHEPHDPAASRARLFSEVSAILEQLSRGEPLVLVLEDLQWADGSTLDLVAYLAHALRTSRVLLLATYRNDAAAADHVHRLAAEVRREGTLVELGPLRDDEIDALVAATVDEPLPTELADAVRARSEGNPFFANELAAAAARGADELPPAVRDLLLTSVTRLDEETRALLRVVAAAGREVPYELLKAVTPDAVSHGALRQAVDQQVLVAGRTTPSYRLRHALFGEAIYATLLPGEREELHARIAQALTHQPALATGTAPAAEQAQHWVAARRPVEALEASLRAARDAEAVSGLGEALTHLERVLELWEEVPTAESLAGVALPTVLSWAAELAGARSIGVTEARELYPLAVLLESIAVRQSPPFSAAALHVLEEANERMRTAPDACTASVADDDFHAALTAGCDNERLLGALRPVKRALLRYEQLSVLDPVGVERSVGQHHAIVEALREGDHARASQRVRENLTVAPPDLSRRHRAIAHPR